jgi:ankyrin repeat protein
MRVLLEENAPVDLKLSNEQTSLHLAAMKGRLECSTLPPDARADGNAKGSLTQTPLHLAAENEEVEIVQLLIKYKVDTLIETDTGAQAIHYAAREESKDVVEYLLDHIDCINARRILPGFITP